MESKIARAIKMKHAPVAVLWSDTKPPGALQFKEDKWACVASLIMASAKGSTIVFDEKTCGCNGGAAALGFERFTPGFTEYLLASGKEGVAEGKFYKKTPEYAWEFLSNLPEVPTSTRYVVLKPLAQVSEGEEPKAVIFLVNADQISALVFLASYDRPTVDNVAIDFCGGCHSTLLKVLEQAEKKYPKAIVGMTDPSARLYIEADLLSFSVPYNRFLEMEEYAEESFLTKEIWKKIAGRI